MYLTADQEKAVEEINAWLKSDEKHFILTGGPGRGKTTTVNNILSTSILGITISHMARLVLSKSIPNSKSFASAVGLTMTYTDDLGIRFAKRKNFKPKLKKIKLVVWDEMSMIDWEEVRELEKHLSKDCKILFVGDKNQLPKIGSNKDSSLFKIPGIELIEPIRQKEGDAILTVVDAVGDVLDSKATLDDFAALPSSQIKEGRGYAFTTPETAIGNFVSSLLDEEDSICVAFRNVTRNKINKEVRLRLWEERAKNQFNIGEVLIATNQYCKGGWRNGIFVPFGKPIIYNSQRLTIEKLENRRVKKLYKRWHQFFKLDEQDLKTLNYIYDLLGTGIDCYRIKFRELKEKVYVVKKEDLPRFYRIKRELDLLSIQHGNIGISMQFSSNFATFDYAYCVTIYAAQGQTIDNVYCDMSDVWQTSISTKQKLQSLYVAFSRTKNKLIIF